MNDKNENEILVEIKNIIISGEKVILRLKHIFLGAIKKDNVSINELFSLVRTVLQVFSENIEQLLPDQRKQRLQEIFSAIEETVLATLNALSFTIQEAKSRGEKIAFEDLKSLTTELGAITQIFTETVKRFSQHTSSEIRDLATEVQGHFMRIGFKVAPLIQGLIISQQQSTEHDAHSQKTVGIATLVANTLRIVADKIDKKIN
jgi:hypothetical protein